MRDFDLIVIGGGSGGIATARRAAKYGARVLLIEGGVIGGTCVNVGCVPKKVLWNASVIGEALRLSGSYGLGHHVMDLDYAHLKTARDAYIARLNAVYDTNLAAAKIERVQGWAKMADAKTVVVGAQRFTAPHILLATGSKPTLPDLPGAEFFATSDDFFSWETLPAKVAILGSGYIAVELAGVLRALGAEVHLCLRGDRLLRRFDGEIVQHLSEQMRRDGIIIHTNFDLQALHQSEGTITLDAGTATITGFAKVLAAIGREPNTDLNLSSAGVQLNELGHIIVDAYQNTTQPGIYAVGDVTGKVELTPVAIAAGRLLAERLFNPSCDRQASKLDYDNIASVIFSHPPIGTVGLSEEAARLIYETGTAEGAGAGHAAAGVTPDGIQVHKSSFVNMFYAPSEHKPRTLMKIITRRCDDRVVGMHVVGMGADEMIQGFAVALKMGATKKDLDATVAIHPTAAEEFVTM